MQPLQLASIARALVRRRLADPNHLQFSKQLPFNQFVREHRTISLEVPRHTGKTTALCELFHQRPSMLVVPRFIMKDHLPPEIKQHERVCTIENLHNVGLRLHRSGVKIDQLLVDEHTQLNPPRREALDEFIFSLEGLVSDDFMVIQMGT